jgi:predicted O-methyltransferase YrrM
VWQHEIFSKSKQRGKDEFDRSVVRISVTPDARIRKLFSNAPFGLSYMPVMRHFMEKLKPLNVLEWGPGRSTLMLAESLPDAQIVSIEHNPKWHERIVKLAEIYPSITSIHELITLEPGKAGTYITAPLYLDRKFDLDFYRRPNEN